MAIHPPTQWLLGLSLISTISLSVALNADGSTPTVYSQIADVRHPTLNDYKLLQDFLTNGERNLSEMKDTEYIVRHVQIVPLTEKETIESDVIAVHCTPTDRENCVLMYSSFNRNYPKALKRVVETITSSDFSGHLMYRLGGWPNTEEGDLTIAHVPYAFKVCMFREARKMGFKRCLWIDSSVIPLVSLNRIFEMIKEKGYLVFGGTESIQPYMNAKAAAGFDLSLEQTGSIRACAAFILGIDFAHEKAGKIVDLWYNAARHPTAFFSARSDQNALSIILHQLQLTDWGNMDKLPHVEIGEKPRSDSLFLIDRIYAHHPIKNQVSTPIFGPGGQCPVVSP
jgi:hypothetical protein